MHIEKGVKALKLSSLLSLDVRLEGNREALQEALSKLPFFSEDNITTDDIEKAIKKMQKKYPIKLAYISSVTGDQDEEEPPYYFSCMIKRTDNHVHVKTVWGVTLHESLSKVALLMFSYINNVLKKEGG